MTKYLLILGILASANGAAACGLQDDTACSREQSGAQYAIEVPTEKFITNCDPGVDCHHMDSGQHYSLQAPITNGG